MAGVGSSVSVWYLPSSTTPTTSARLPPQNLKCPPTAFSTDPKTLRANSRFTTAAMEALSSSCMLKGSADEESSSGSTKIVRRDTEVLGIDRSVRRAKIGGCVGVCVGISSANTERKTIGISHSIYTRDRRGGIEHAFLHLHTFIGFISCHVQIGLYEHLIIGLNTVVAL